jgi:ABC-type nitrate/sulfonate/bicarbonate transport system ATPase subunit
MGLSEEQLKNFSETGFIKRDNHKNFDVHFTIEAKNISIDDHSEALEGLKENAGLKSVKNAFKKQLGGGKAARVFANQFIAAVAS